MKREKVSTYSREQVVQASLAYFDGDELAADVFVKYALRDKKLSFLEKTPEEMHRRIAKEFAKIEKKYPNPMSEEEIFQLLDHFKYIIPAGSPMFGIGNPNQKISLSNCFVLDVVDSYGGICRADERIVQISKRRGGCVEENSFVRIKDRGIVKIKDVNVGEEILSYNIGTNKSEYKEVLDKYYTDVKKENQIKIMLNNGFEIKTSKTHPMLILENGKYIYKKAGELRVKNICVAFEENRGSQNVRVKKIAEDKEELKYIDLFIKDNNNYYAGSVGLINIHNCGLDISPLRPKGMATRNSALTTDGIGVFMERFSRASSEVAQSGRRGALLLSISVHHPEIMTFINIKRDLQKVNGANISIRVTDEFMEAVKKDIRYEQRWPVDAIEPKIRQKVRAKEVWDEMIKSVYLSAEPGILFWDNIIKNSPADSYAEEGFTTTSTNPCCTGETLVCVAEGRGNVAIKDLAKEGKDVPVFCYDDKGSVVIRTMRNPRITGYAQPVFKVTLDDGSVIRTTANHKFRLADGTYKEVSSLKSGDSLKILTKAEHAAKKKSAKTNIENPNPTGKDLKATPNIIKTLISAIEQGYDTVIKNNIVFVKKNCEGCDSEFWTKHSRREVSFCTHKCATIHAALKQHSLLSKHWLSSKELKTSTELYNLKVVSVELDGHEDVYNGTVDDFHNFFVGGFEGKTKQNKRKSLYINGLQCGELPLPGYDACRLISINLSSYVDNPFTDQAVFDKKKFKDHVGFAMKLSDDLVDLELEAIKRIIRKVKSDPEDNLTKANELDLWESIKDKCQKGRRVGLGITGLADCIAELNKKYGSEESIQIVDMIYSMLRDEAYKTSILLAKERGSFPIYDPKQERGNQYLMRLPESIKKEMRQYGRRNISCLTTPPTGSVSIAAQTSWGFEPVFKVAYKRKRKLNENDKEKPDFVDETGNRWKEYICEHPGFKKYKKITGKDLAGSPFEGAQAEEIDYKARVKMQGVATNYVDHAISSTVNLPHDIPQKVVGELYLSAWEQGCKGLTVYRAGSRDGVITGVDSTRECADCDEAAKTFSDLVKAGKRPTKIIIASAPKRPDIMECDIHRSKVGGGDWLFFVGKLNGMPYEVFGGDSEKFTVPFKYKNGWIQKNGKVDGVSQYNIILGSLEDKNEKLEFKGITKHFNNSEYGAFTRVISLTMRHGVPIKYICEQITKKEVEGDLYSFQRAMARVLKKYIAEGERSEIECPHCHSTEMVYKNGCPECKVCGYSNCS